MDERKKIILNTVIREHIKSGAPVGSSILVEKYKLKISPATVRNEMAALEEDGYIMQPHTSAGRIPTEKAYRLYLDNLREKKLSSGETKIIDELLFDKQEINFKNVAKHISHLSGNTVFWAFHRHNLFYTGITNLFQQPEFSQLDQIYDISAVIDRIDEIVDSIYESVKQEHQVLIGSENPFGNFCSTILTKYRLNDRTGMFGILGPMRMDYEKNIAIVNYVKELITN
jgi:heat-inducible transcriptional repressor